jgi:hypothetical protein
MSLHAKEWRMSMADILDGTKAPAHGMFFMESAGGYHPRMETTAEERQPSCFVSRKKRVSVSRGLVAEQALLS